MHELGDAVTGKVKRTSHDQVTLFKSLGLAYEDVAFCKLIVDKAKAKGVGTELPMTEAPMGGDARASVGAATLTRDEFAPSNGTASRRWRGSCTGSTRATARRGGGAVRRQRQVGALARRGLVRGPQADRREHRTRPKNEASRHCMSNFVLDVKDADHAELRCYLTVFRNDAAGPDPVTFPIKMQLPAGVLLYSTSGCGRPKGWRIAEQWSERIFTR